MPAPGVLPAPGATRGQPAAGGGLCTALGEDAGPLATMMERHEVDNAVACAVSPGALDSAFMERSGAAWVVRDDHGGPILASFEGVAYCGELGVYVYTTLDDSKRHFRQLGSATYSAALGEAEALRAQMALDL